MTKRASRDLLLPPAGSPDPDAVHEISHECHRSADQLRSRSQEGSSRGQELTHHTLVEVNMGCR